jgi:thiamine phosphate synthase YjbQ (UPF0047 family)
MIFVISTLLMISQANAHSGRLDKKGGHNCSQKSKEKGLCTGYHYHSGGGLHFDETDELITAENIHLLKHVDDDRSIQRHDRNHHHNDSQERNDSVLQPRYLHLQSPRRQVDAG